MDTRLDLSRDIKMYVSETAPKVLAIGKSRHHAFRVVGFGPVPESEFVMGLWRVVPHSTPPLVAKKRIDLVYAYGIQINGYVVIHEPSVREALKPPVSQPSQSEANVKPIISNADAASIAGGFAVGMAVLGSIFLSVVLSDPSYIIVCGPENVWIEVLNDYE